MKMKLKGLLKILSGKKKNDIVDINDVNSGECAKGKVCNVIKWAKDLSETYKDECEFIFMNDSDNKMFQVTNEMIPTILRALEWKNNEDCLDERDRELIYAIYTQLDDNDKLKKKLFDSYEWFLKEYY